MSSILAYPMKIITERRRKLDVYIFFHYHSVDTFAGGLLTLDGIIRLVVSVSVLTRCFTYELMFEIDLP